MRFGPPSRSSSRRSSARGSACAERRRIEQVDAAGLKAQLARAREIAERALGVGGDESCLRRSAGRARCTPSPRCRAQYVGFDLSRRVAGVRAVGARSLLPRTAAHRRGAGHRWRRARSWRQRTPSRPPCARGCRGRAAHPGRAGAELAARPMARTRRSMQGTLRFSSGTHISLS